jgi:hypothetical protein
MSLAGKIKKLFDDSNVKVDSTVDDRILNDAITALDDSEKVKSTPAEPNIRRIIMKSSITKLAAVAMIIIAVLIGIYYSGGSIDGSSVALGQAIENMKKMPWMLITTQEKNIVVEKQWFGFDSDILAFKSNRNGEFTYYNNEKEEFEYTYSPERFQQGVIYYSRDQNEFLSPGKGQSVPETAFEVTGKIIEDLEKETQKVKRKIVNQNGEKVEVIAATIASDGSKVEIRRSIGRNLILSIKKDYSKKSNLSDYTCTFSYPVEGPESIYDLGVPKDAEIKDVTIPAEIADLMKKLKTIRQTTLTNYVALSLPAEIEQIPTSFTDSRPIEEHLASLIWRKGNERCDSRGYFSSPKGAPTIGSISGNIQSASDSFVTVSSCIYKAEEGKIYSYEMVNAKPVHDEYRAVIESMGGKIFIELINWPYIMVLRNFPFQWKISSVMGTDNETLIKIERSGVGTKGTAFGNDIYRWFINPDRNYICQRFEYGNAGQEPVERIDVLEYAETESGQLYPHIIKKTANRLINGKEQQQTSSRIIYLQENPVFPNSIFDPNTFPKE